MRSKGVNDIGKPVGETAESRHEQLLDGADVGVEPQPCDDRARVGIRERRAIAEKLRQDVDVAGEQRRLARASRARDDAPFQKFQDFHAA